MADERISLPQSGGGLVRYSEEAPSKFMMSPTSVMVLIGIIVVLYLLFNFGVF